MTLRRRRPGLVYPVREDWHYVGEAGEPAFKSRDRAFGKNLAQHLDLPVLIALHHECRQQRSDPGG